MIYFKKIPPLCFLVKRSFLFIKRVKVQHKSAENVLASREIIFCDFS